MAHRTWSLRWLIGGVYFVIMTIILGVLALYFSHRTTVNYLESMINTRSGQASLAVSILAPLLSQWEPDASARYTLLKKQAAVHPLSPDADHELQQLEALHSTLQATMRSIFKSILPCRRVVVLRIDGTIIKDAEAPSYPVETPVHHLPPEVSEALASTSGIGAEIRFDTAIEEECLFVAVPIDIKASSIRRIGVLVLVSPTSEVRQTISDVNQAIALVFILGIVILFFINASVSSSITRPLATLSSAAQRFAHDNQVEHVQPTGAAEIAILGESFNQMTTQLSQTITRLAEERAKAEAILASMVDGVIVTDTHERILLMNHSAEQLLELPANDAVGKTVQEVIPHDELHSLLHKTIESALPLRQEIHLTVTTDYVIEVHLAPVIVEEHAQGIVIVFYDITHQRNQEQVRRDFVANVSHELRTPVTSIRAMAETLFDSGADNPELLMEFLGTIIHETERLTALLDDLLLLARSESGRRLITPEPNDICDIIRHVAKRLITPITAKHQQLTLDIPEHLIFPVDHDAFVQIMVNLLDNAQKYSPGGGAITVAVEQDDMLRVKVIDTGIGIPEQDLERVFERFYRVDKGRSRAQGGTGLGLAIVRHLVELHGGRIFARSEIGAGSVFTVVLPMPDALPLREAVFDDSSVRVEVE